MKPHSLPDFRALFQPVGPVLRAVALTLCAAMPVQAQQVPLVQVQRLTASAPPPQDAFFGNVRASEISSLSYGARGCIVEISEEARRERVVQAGQVLVRLDDLRAQLALRTAEARLSDLAASIQERQLALDAAIADDRRRKQELELVTKEFDRSSVLMGRSLINESTMDTIEQRFMDAKFTSERAGEAIANARAALKRAEIAHEIGQLDKRAAEITLSDTVLTAPFDGVLVGFDPNVGDCVQEGEQAARAYVPDRKSVDVFFRIKRLTDGQAGGLAVGSPVGVTRVNGAECAGTITRIDTEADLESQFVEATVDVEPSCAPSLFLNEAVEVKAAAPAKAAYTVPNSAISGENTVYLLDEATGRVAAMPAQILNRGAARTTLRLPGAEGRLIVVQSDTGLADGLAVATQ